MVGGDRGLWNIHNPGSPMYESAHFISSRTLSGLCGRRQADCRMPDRDVLGAIGPR